MTKDCCFSQIVTAFNVVDHMKELFYLEQENPFRYDLSNMSLLPSFSIKVYRNSNLQFITQETRSSS